MKKSTIFILAIFISHFTFNIDFCKAQWIQTNCTTNYDIFSFAVSGTNIFAGTQLGGGVFISTNSGMNWTSVGLTSYSINAFVVSGSNVFAGAYYGGVYLSTNNGTNWTTVNNGLTNTYIKALAISGSKIFAGTWASSGIYSTTNNGTNWVVSNTGLTIPYIYSLAVSGSNVFAGTSGGVFRSTNNGSSWAIVNSGLTNLNVRSLLTSGSNTFAGTDSGAFLSTNNGTNWTTISNGLTGVSFVWSFAVSGTNIFAGTNNGVFLTTNNGQNWFQKNQGFTQRSIPAVYTMLIANNYIFAGTDNQSVWRRSFTEIIGIKPISEIIPSSFALQQNYPNPFNPVTTIKFALPKAGDVKLKIYDVLGKEADILYNGYLNAGYYQISFNAVTLSSGIYFFKLITDNFVDTKRMVLLK